MITTSAARRIRSGILQARGDEPLVSGQFDDLVRRAYGRTRSKASTGLPPRGGGGVSRPQWAPVEHASCRRGVEDTETLGRMMSSDGTDPATSNAIAQVVIDVFRAYYGESLFANFTVRYAIAYEVQRLQPRPVIADPTLLEQGRVLASERETLIAQGADPTELVVPLDPTAPSLAEVLDDQGSIRQLRRYLERESRQWPGPADEDFEYTARRTRMVEGEKRALESEPTDEPTARAIARGSEEDGWTAQVLRRRKASPWELAPAANEGKR